MAAFHRLTWAIVSGVAFCAVFSLLPGCRKQGEKTTARHVVNEEAKQVLADLSSAWTGVEAFSLDMATEAKRDIGDRAESRSKGGYRFQKIDGQEYIHYFVSGAIVFWVGDDKYGANERVQFATDGKVLEKLTLQPDLRELLRTPYSHDKVLLLGGNYLYDMLLEEYDLQVTGEEVNDGRDVVVIKATTLNHGGSTVYHFDKATGIVMRQFEYDAAGDPIFKMENTNLNLIPGFTDEDFTYLPPENITIIDETGAERIIIPYTPEEHGIVDEQPSDDDAQPAQPKEE